MGCRRGCSILPPNAVGLGSKMGQFSPLPLLKNHNYSEGSSFSDLWWRRHKNGHFNSIKPFLIRSLACFHCVGFVFCIVALDRKYALEKQKMEKDLKAILPSFKTQVLSLIFNTGIRKTQWLPKISPPVPGRKWGWPSRIWDAAPSCWMLPHQSRPWRLLGGFTFAFGSPRG